MYKREIRTSITKKDKKLHNQHKNVLIKTVRTHITRYKYQNTFFKCSNAWFIICARHSYWQVV